MKTSTAQIGDTIAVIIPDEMMRKMKWNIGDKVNVEYDKKQKMIVIQARNHKII